MNEIDITLTKEKYRWPTGRLVQGSGHPPSGTRTRQIGISSKRQKTGGNGKLASKQRWPAGIRQRRRAI